MDKYSWEFNKNAEIWRNDTFDTIEECIIAAKNAVVDYDIYNEEPTTVFIGKNIPFMPLVDGEQILNDLQEQAIEHARVIGQDWESRDYREIKELNEKLTAVVREWLKKYGYDPYFYSVELIKEYSLSK